MRTLNEATDLWQAYRAGCIGQRELRLFSRRLPASEVEHLRDLLRRHGLSDVAELLPGPPPPAVLGLRSLGAAASGTGSAGGTGSVSRS
jgi:hypothetical protein